MTTHSGLPVAGYKSQPQGNVDLVNANKVLEERVLRQIDHMKGLGTAVDQRMVALAMTGIQEAFMWMNRAVFQPGRVQLPEDNNSPE